MTKSKASADVHTVLENLAGGKKGAPQKLFIYSEKPKEKGDVIPFGIPEIDEATGIGGIMRGKLVELYGPESGGKSCLAYKLMGSAQRLYPEYAGLIDVEHSFVEKWAMQHGVDTSKLIWGSEFDHGEDALDTTRKLIESRKCSIVVLDSTAALIPKAELEASLEDSKMAELGRIMSRSVKQVMDAAAKTNTAVVFVNQIRSKIGVMFGNPETTPGGRALKFYAHMRISVRKIGSIKSKDTGKLIGITSRVKMEKNKLDIPYGQAEFVIPFSAELNNPMVRLVQRAYDMKMLRKKNIKDENRTVIMWGTGKDAKEIEADDFVKAADWLVKNDLAAVFAGQAFEKAEVDGLTLEDDILALKDPANIISPLSNTFTEDSSGEEADEVFTKSDE